MVKKDSGISHTFQIHRRAKAQIRRTSNKNEDEYEEGLSPQWQWFLHFKRNSGPTTSKGFVDMIATALACWQTLSNLILRMIRFDLLTKYTTHAVNIVHGGIYAYGGRVGLGEKLVLLC